ncbi:MAG: hypothetical protein K0V04_22180 [Deltaproteobacteria bacterium]|nr:hypothetical protein [Deltaproteobacteria bacterium]
MPMETTEHLDRIAVLLDDELNSEIDPDATVTSVAVVNDELKVVTTQPTVLTGTPAPLFP